MSDDLIDRLRECAECKSSEAWGRIDGGQDLCIGAALATEAADELSRLRAEVERLTAALSDERAHADALAEAVNTMDGFAVEIRDDRGRFYSVRAKDYERLDNLTRAHRARRQG